MIPYCPMSCQSAPDQVHFHDRISITETSRYAASSAKSITLI
ncbi:unnamed protein product, partial [Staurois parvus]